MTRAEALTLLLAMPDPPDLVRRGVREVLPRDPSRDPWVIKRDLGVAYAERRRQAWTDGDISCVVTVRKFRVVRSA